MLIFLTQVWFFFRVHFALKAALRKKWKDKIKQTASGGSRADGRLRWIDKNKQQRESSKELSKQNERAGGKKRGRSNEKKKRTRQDLFDATVAKRQKDETKRGDEEADDDEKVGQRAKSAARV